MSLSCKDENGYTYAIKDFRKSLQPFLFKIVSKGVVMGYDSSLRNMATDKELTELSKSEHPVLRASAFREILYRKSFNHFDVLMNHLDDTAIVATDAGEFGIWDRTVSDDIIEEAKWETDEAKNKTIELVLTKHNYLRSAYLILLEIEPQEKYYPSIKDMATRPRRMSDNGYELEFYDIERAMYGLANFKKPEDVKIIKRQMMQKISELSYVSFRLMKEFPDTAYFDVLQRYHRRQFYKFSGNRRGGFSGYIQDRADPEDFIQALVMQQSDKSAKLLDTILNRLPLQTCLPDKDYILKEVMMEIREHPCPAYKKLLEKIELKVEQGLRSQIISPRDSAYLSDLAHDSPFKIPADTAKEKIRW